MLRRVSRRLAADLAIDLGTANTLIWSRDAGIVLNEPSMVALSGEGGRVVAVGREAKEMYGKTSEPVRVVRQMKDGVIANFDATTTMVSTFLRQALRSRRLLRPVLVMGVPSGITQVEKSAVIEAALATGARRVFLLNEPMAAALGANLPIEERRGSMVVDIGGGTTDVAVISLSAVAYSECIRVAGDEMDEAIIQYVSKRYKVEIGPFEAERVKMELGSAFPLLHRYETEVRGRGLRDGIPRTVQIDDAGVREALESPVRAVVEAVRRALEQTSPELAADIARYGVALAGGGCLLKGMVKRLHEETQLFFYRADDPLTTVVRGAGKVLEDLPRYRRVCAN